MEVDQQTPSQEEAPRSSPNNNRQTATGADVPRSGHILSTNPLNPSNASPPRPPGITSSSTGRGQSVSTAVQSSNSPIWQPASAFNATNATSDTGAMAAQHYFLTRLIQARDMPGLGNNFYAAQRSIGPATYRSALEGSLPVTGQQLQSQIQQQVQQMRPQFRSKVVCVLTCKHCESVVCKRGMKAILLADMNVRHFSVKFSSHILIRRSGGTILNGCPTDQSPTRLR